MNDPLKNSTPDEPFKEPDGYFESLEERIMARVNKENKPSDKPVIKRFDTTRWMAVAASFILLIVAGWLFWPQNETPDPMASLSEVSDDSIIEYLMESDLTAEDILVYSNKTDKTDLLNNEVIPDVDLSNKDIDVLIDTYNLNEL